VRRQVLLTLTMFVAVIAALLLSGIGGRSSGVLCETFDRTPQPGLFDTFHGRVCSDDPAVKRIAANFNECVKSGATLAVCENEQLGYFASSGAYPDDAQKALLLVLRAAGRLA